MVCCSHQSDRRIRVCISHQSERRFCSLVWEVLKFQRSNGVYRASWEMRKYLTDVRYQITCSKRVAHAVKMVDSCSRDNGVLCTVAWSWLLFLHDESEWKNFELNIAWGVDEFHQTFWFEQFFNGCVVRFMTCWVCRLYFSGLVCLVISLDECLIKVNYGWFCVCFRCLEKVILWSRLCLAKDDFRYHR